MDLVNNLMADRGCNVDGTTSNNPVSALIENLFDSNVGLVDGFFGLDADNEQPGMVFYENAEVTYFCCRL